MRSHPTVQVGQVWQANDTRPERLRLVKVVYVGDGYVTVVNRYPSTGRVVNIPALRFQQTNHKGFTRVK
jgi:hypothetical protein